MIIKTVKHICGEYCHSPLTLKDKTLHTAASPPVRVATPTRSNDDMKNEDGADGSSPESTSRVYTEDENDVRMTTLKESTGRDRNRLSLSCEDEVDER